MSTVFIVVGWAGVLVLSALAWAEYARMKHAAFMQGFRAAEAVWRGFRPEPDLINLAATVCAAPLPTYEPWRRRAIERRGALATLLVEYRQLEQEQRAS